MTDPHLISQLEKRGYKGRIMPIRRLGDLQEEIEKHYRQGLFDEQFYQESLTSFTFIPPDSLPEARSVIVVAVPRPQFQVVFAWRGKRVSVLVPSYYLGWREAEKQLKDLLFDMPCPWIQNRRLRPGRWPTRRPSPREEDPVIEPQRGGSRPRQSPGAGTRRKLACPSFVYRKGDRMRVGWQLRGASRELKWAR